MPRARIAMHTIREILRLRHECGCSQREIARSCGLATGRVNRLLRQAEQAGLEWPLPPDWDEAELHERLYGRRAGARPSARREALDFAAVHKQLSQRKHLTLQLVWQEYRQQHPDGYGYSQFCELYRDWKARRDLVMLQEHKAGDRIFVDYAGATVPIYLVESAEPRPAHVFVAVLGASSYFYTEASWGQVLLRGVDLQRLCIRCGGSALPRFVRPLHQGVAVRVGPGAAPRGPSNSTSPRTRHSPLGFQKGVDLTPTSTASAESSTT